MDKLWKTHFTDRQKKEIAFCVDYAKKYNHGTDGHIRLVLIAKMAELLDQGLVPITLEKPDENIPAQRNMPPAGA